MSNVIGWRCFPKEKQSQRGRDNKQNVIRLFFSHLVFLGLFNVLWSLLSRPPSARLGLGLDHLSFIDRRTERASKRERKAEAPRSKTTSGRALERRFHTESWIETGPNFFLTFSSYSDLWGASWRGPGGMHGKSLSFMTFFSAMNSRTCVKIYLFFQQFCQRMWDK